MSEQTVVDHDGDRASVQAHSGARAERNVEPQVIASPAALASPKLAGFAGTAMNNLKHYVE